MSAGAGLGRRQTFIIDEDTRGQRLDIFAGRRHPAVSRAYIRKIIDQGELLVNGAAAKAGHKLRLGDKVSIPNLSAVLSSRPPEINLPIIYEDDDCLVINKPVGVLTHARGGDQPGELEPSVASFIRQHVTELTGERAGIVHRLDRATSGVMIGAKNEATLSFLQKQFAQRKTHKTYLAVVTGHLKQPEAVIDMPIERNPKAPATFRVGANGKNALTHYKVVAQSPHYSLVELQPETGRTHQLRVHLAQIGHPIVGDLLYGGQAAPRLMLHAAALEITTPGGQRHTFSAPEPAIFKELLASDN